MTQTKQPTQIMKKPKAVLFFAEELNQIRTVELNAFFTNVLGSAPGSFQIDKELMTLVKKAHKILSYTLDQQNVDGQVKEAMLGSVLIARILKNEFRAPYENLYAIATRGFIKEKGFQKDLGHDGIWENIMRAVEGHIGADSPSILLEPRPGTAEHEIFNAYRIAEMDFLELKTPEKD